MDRFGKNSSQSLRLRALVATFLAKAASLFAKAIKWLFVNLEQKQNVTRPGGLLFHKELPGQEKAA